MGNFNQFGLHGKEHKQVLDSLESVCDSTKDIKKSYSKYMMNNLTPELEKAYKELENLAARHAEIARINSIQEFIDYTKKACDNIAILTQHTDPYNVK